MASLQQVTLLPSGLRVSRVGLGLSHLHHLVFGCERRRLIDAARDLGVTHFDAARLYGDGLAERELGRAVRHARGSVTIATKFGLIPNDRLGALGSFARPFWAWRALMRKAGRSRWPGRSFTADAMRASLETSLRLLRTDYVDVLFLHEPLPKDLNDNERLIEAMSSAKSRGDVRHLGLAGGGVDRLDREFPGVFDVIQMPEANAPAATRPPDFTYGVVGAWRDAAAARGGPAVGDVSHAWSEATARRPNGAVLVGTTRVAHLRLAVERVAENGA